MDALEAQKKLAAKHIADMNNWSNEGELSVLRLPNDRSVNIGAQNMFRDPPLDLEPQSQDKNVLGADYYYNVPEEGGNITFKFTKATAAKVIAEAEKLLSPGTQVESGEGNAASIAEGKTVA